MVVGLADVFLFAWKEGTRVREDGRRDAGGGRVEVAERRREIEVELDARTEERRWTVEELKGAWWLRGQESVGPARIGAAHGRAVGGKLHGPRLGLLVPSAVIAFQSVQKPSTADANLTSLFSAPSACFLPKHSLCPSCSPYAPLSPPASRSASASLSQKQPSTRSLAWLGARPSFQR